MKRNSTSVILLIITIAGFSVIGQSNAQSETICESCPMTVGTEAKEHLKITDGSDTIHYACCIGCALKILKNYDTLRIETFCDWYGPDYPIIAQFSQHGNLSDIHPTTALLLIGGGCTGNRVAYNQTAADALLAEGFSEYTMKMMQQPLPTNTNMTSISTRAMMFAITSEEGSTQSYELPVTLAIVGIIVIAGALIAYKKFSRK